MIDRTLELRRVKYCIRFTRRFRILLKFYLLQSPCRKYSQPAPNTDVAAAIPIQRSNVAAVTGLPSTAWFSILPPFRKKRYTETNRTTQSPETNVTSYTRTNHDSTFEFSAQDTLQEALKELNLYNQGADSIPCTQDRSVPLSQARTPLPYIFLSRQWKREDIVYDPCYCGIVLFSSLAPDHTQRSTRTRNPNQLSRKKDY